VGHGFLGIVDHRSPLQPGFLVCRVVFQHRGEVTPGTGTLPGLAASALRFVRQPPLLQCVLSRNRILSILALIATDITIKPLK
jgi:hypothetical protein